MIHLFFLALLLSVTDNEFLSGVDSSTTFTLVNNCAYTIWPVILSTGSSPIPTTGFVLQEGYSEYIQAPSSWIGRLWARTNCSENLTGKFTCITGDCGSGKIECDGGLSPHMPTTLVEFSINISDGRDFYDVSLVDGYNLPLLVAPQGRSSENCKTAGCLADINAMCPSPLRVTAEGGDDIACKSACSAFNQDMYCCTGAYNSPSTCQPTNYSGFFKKWCPQAYSYAYDDDSLFTCSDTNYAIIFCPVPSTRKSSPDGDTFTISSINSTTTISSINSKIIPSVNSTINNTIPSINSTIIPSINSKINNTIPSINSTIIYDGVKGFNTTGAASTCMHVLRPQTVAGAVAISIAMWRLCHTH